MSFKRFLGFVVFLFPLCVSVLTPLLRLVDKTFRPNKLEIFFPISNTIAPFTAYDGLNFNQSPDDYRIKISFDSGDKNFTFADLNKSISGFHFEKIFWISPVINFFTSPSLEAQKIVETRFCKIQFLHKRVNFVEFDFNFQSGKQTKRISCPL